MVTEYYKTLIHSLKNERKELDKRIQILEQWMNGQTVEVRLNANTSSEKSEIASKAMTQYWAKKKEAKSQFGKGSRKKYNGTHWMQRRGNRKRVLAAIRKMQRTSAKKRSEIRKREQHGNQS